MMDRTNAEGQGIAVSDVSNGLVRGQNPPPPGNKGTERGNGFEFDQPSGSPPRVMAKGRPFFFGPSPEWYTMRLRDPDSLFLFPRRAD